MFTHYSGRPDKRPKLPRTDEAIIMSEQFWSGGRKAYAKEIRQHYTQLWETLRTQRDAAGSDGERARLETEVNRVQAEYKSKLDSINDAIF